MRKIFLVFGFSAVLCAALVSWTVALSAREAFAQEDFASERILSFHSDIAIQEDGALLVRETIRVVALGVEIRRGIYRDFPTVYRDRLGKRAVVGFDLLEVERDGEPEPYHTERQLNGIRVYIGQEDVFLQPGVYEYAIAYRTTNQLGFFPEHDELYWNVTGTGWVFPIDAASARVALPEGVPRDAIRIDGFTGPQGATGKNFRGSIGSDGNATFATTVPLGAYEGLTIVAGWPKGFVIAPTKFQTALSGVAANFDFLLGFGGLFLVLAYYLVVWKRYGKDPARGTIIAQYEPPVVALPPRRGLPGMRGQGAPPFSGESEKPKPLSPAALRYIRRMGSDDEAVASAVIAMAVKGYLTVSEEKHILRSTYTLVRKSGATLERLAEEELLLAEHLFLNGETIELKNEHHTQIRKALDALEKSLKRQYGRGYFRKNRRALAPGIALSLLLGPAAIVAAVMLRGDFQPAVTAIFVSFTLLAYVAANVVFSRLLRAPTKEGRRLLDEIEGFRLFLSVTEKDRLAFHNPPEKTPELFERFLPYALALDVEHEWAEQFAEVFARLRAQRETYAPSWYAGRSFSDFKPSQFTSSLSGAFAGAIASSATPPGSSSGFGGGGSSGGGGGGGGGGGW